MATAPLSRPLVESLEESGGKRRSSRRKTAHLKLVPPSKAERTAMRAKCEEVADRLDKGRPLTKDEMEAVARTLLQELDQPEGYLGWTMVMLATAFWREQVATVPPSRRLFLLPHCLKHAEGCPADYDEFGLDCKTCGACSIADFRTMAEDMGYKVLVAEGSPIVLKIIVSGYVDAIVGVACLNVLEKAIDKVLLAGIPCMAVPLLSSDCRNTAVDEDWVSEMIRIEPKSAASPTRSYVHLMRAASNLFEPDELERLAPRLRGGPRMAEVNGRGLAGIDPIAATEALAYDFLGKGGKHSRPFITLAVHDALTGGHGTSAGGAEHLRQVSDGVRRAAMSIETFHKASLVHDDIEDDDDYRYGQETLHRRFGIPTAINVGDFLIGLGYRLVSRETPALGAETVAEILDHLADAHLKLSEGQGAELLWRDSLDKRLKPIDALKIYALKTAPAFEVALYTGARLAGSADQYAEAIKQFARNLGVAFQILNDLNDWHGDSHNKLSAGGDTLGGRPTVLWALALEQLPAEKQRELLSLVAGESGSGGVGRPAPNAGGVGRPAPNEHNGAAPNEHNGAAPNEHNGAAPNEHNGAAPNEHNGAAPNASQRVQRVRQLYQEAGVFEQAHRLVDKHQQRAEAIADALESDELRRLFYYLIDTVLERPEETASPAIETVELVANSAR